tara:strand:- start:35623 stop:36108 length:486 start_codon:yes stop_codon:yes gene_type:complete
MNDPVAEFADAASRFIGWCDGMPGNRVPEARAALGHVAELYHLALPLRELEDAPEADGDRISLEQWQAVFQRFASLPFNYYTSVFDPRIADGIDSEAGVGDLADDLADIYRDLHGGLRAFRAGAVDTAEYEWAWSFRMHWGRHAASALHALHCWFADEAAW